MFNVQTIGDGKYTLIMMYAKEKGSFLTHDMISYTGWDRKELSVQLEKLYTSGKLLKGTYKY